MIEAALEISLRNQTLFFSVQTCRHGVSYEISSMKISKKVTFLHSMCVFSFFSRLAGENAFLDGFLMFSLLFGHLCGF